MAAASSGPKVVGVVDEGGNTVSVGVVEGGKFLPVASAALDYARGRDLAAPKAGKAESAGEEGGE